MTAIECMSVSPDLRKNHCGFTLVEIAIAIFIITILLGSILVPLTTQIEQRQVSETQKMLEDIREALIGHAVAKGYLPCPDRTTTGGGGANDTAHDGVEDHSAGSCLGPSISAGAIRMGNVPWQTLGLGASDPWGNRFRYMVSRDYAQRSPFVPSPFNLTSTSAIVVCSTWSGCPGTGSVRLTPISPDGAVAVILSFGRNGFGAISAQTSALNPTPTSFDETGNYSGGPLVSRVPSLPGSTAGEFDDIVIWLGKYTLYNRMVAADKLP
jgi:prepilin-type N-terminal cleavage/methylation domain-containing protein